jgi:hypothetical protein
VQYDRKKKQLSHSLGNLCLRDKQHTGALVGVNKIN